jgi:peptidylprolyl isomerase
MAAPPFMPPPDAQKTASGLASVVLTAGHGDTRVPAAARVRVMYAAWAEHGGAEDTAPQPAEWTLDALVPGLREGVALMIAGETRRLWMPPSLAYGIRRDRPAGMLVVDVTVVEILPSDPIAPPAFAPAPADATKTASGVAYRIVHRGSSTERPRPTSTVTIHYRGWTPNGELFDDSRARQQPLVVAVDTLMPGLAEALTLIGSGDRAQVWVPAALAYGPLQRAAPSGLAHPPGPPETALVFDVELLGIQRADAGAPGTIVVQTNSPQTGYDLVRPDGVVVRGQGNATFASLPPGPYRLKPDAVRGYEPGVSAAPHDRRLAPGGELRMTLAYQSVPR